MSGRRNRRSAMLDLLRVGDRVIISYPQTGSLAGWRGRVVERSTSGRTDWVVVEIVTGYRVAVIAQRVNSGEVEVTKLP